MRSRSDSSLKMNVTRSITVSSSRTRHIPHKPDISNTKTNQKRYHIISNNTTQKKTNQTNYLLLHTAHPIRRHINIETRLNVKRDRIITCPERIYGRYLHTHHIQMPTSTFMGLASLSVKSTASLSITSTLA